MREYEAILGKETQGYRYAVRYADTRVGTKRSLVSFGQAQGNPESRVPRESCKPNAPVSTAVMCASQNHRATRIGGAEVAKLVSRTRWLLASGELGIAHAKAQEKQEEKRKGKNLQKERRRK